MAINYMKTQILTEAYVKTKLSNETSKCVTFKRVLISNDNLNKQVSTKDMRELETKEN